MTQEGFYFDTADAAMAFYEECIKRKANTREEKMEVLRELIKQKKAIYLRDVEEFAKDKKVLRIKPKGDLNV
jgi:hypothetical protein